jgi:hypothetical protein
MKAAGIIVVALAGMTVYWMMRGQTILTPQSLPTIPGATPTPNTPVNTGPSGVGPGGQPSTLNGPAPGSSLYNQLFPPSP